MHNTETGTMIDEDSNADYKSYFSKHFNNEIYKLWSYIKLSYLCYL